jgi:predicted transglutaminase-like cysteine proteinase
MLKKFLSVFFIVLLFTSNAYARFQTIDDATLVYDLYNTDIKIHKDGTYERTVEMQITLLRENARSLATKFPISYNSDSTSIELIEAKTIYKGKEYIVDKKMIEDKSIGNDRSGFDDHKQISISFPYSEVGSKIYVKYKEHIKNPILDNEFFTNYYLGGEYLNHAKITIDSEIDLQIKVNDPFKKLSVSTEPRKINPNYFRKASITLTEPLYTATANEVYASVLNPSLFTYISVSSIDNWKNLGNKIAVDFIEKQEQPLPKIFTQIVESASKEKSLIDQLNIITSKLNEMVKYFGDWRTRGGKLIPQDLVDVANKKSGDCKDFATVTVKILKELGYQANVALVTRGEGIQQQEHILPSSSIFDHAMVRVIDKGGNILWIDPTNKTSMADGVYPDIAGKTALVLDKEQSSYEKIPEVSENHAKVIITEIIEPSKIINNTIEFQGECAASITALELDLSPQIIQDSFYNYLAKSGVEEQNKISSIIPPLTSRVVKPITVSVTYKKPDIFFKNNLGYGYNLDPQISVLSTLISADPSTNVNDLYIDYPRTLERKVVIEKARAENLENLNFEINTPFVTLSRKCVAVGENVEITTKLVIHTQWIKNSELKSKDFQELQRVIKHEIINSSIILN